MNFFAAILQFSAVLSGCPFFKSYSQASGPTVRFEIELTHGQANPTGTGFRQVIFINGSFVGPTLHVQTGDNVEFLVRNRMREDIAMHFHGISQAASPWADGVPGVTQRPIRPGAAYLYRWQADEPGVYFYHAHARGQIMDGMYGAIIIDAPEETPRPYHMISRDPQDWLAMRAAEKHLQPLMISDWTQYDFTQFNGVQREANIDFTCMDAIIVNGAGSQYCPDREALEAYTSPLVKGILASTNETGITDKGCVPPLQLFQGNYTFHLDRLPSKAFRECVPGVGGSANYTVPVHSGEKWAALTFINPGGLYPLKVTIDSHPLHVFAVDGQYIYPQTVDQILVNNGERYSVFLRLDQEVGKYTVRIANNLLGQVLGGFAALQYNGVTEDAPNPRALMNYAGQPLSDSIRLFDQMDSRPYPPKSLLPAASYSRKLIVRKQPQPRHAYDWTMSGGNRFNLSRIEQGTPFLYQIPAQIDSENPAIVRTKKGQWVDLIIEVEGPFAQAHPMHKHGDKAYLIGAGIGSFPWTSVVEAAKELPIGTFNTIDPPFKDTFQSLEAVMNNSWMVIRYKVNIPGAWLFHCHVQTHLSGGMGIVILDGVDDFPKVPESYLEWNGFEQAGINESR